jgi:Flp pilus assembly CpaF family ATPase
MESGRKDTSHSEKWVEAHNPNSEPMPNSPSNHVASTRAEREAYDVNQKFQDLINSAELKDRRLSGLLKMLKERQVPRYSVAGLRVMVDGEAGKGKTYTLNNVLGFRDISIQACLLSLIPSVLRS